MNEGNNFNDQPQEFNQTEPQVTYQGEVQGTPAKADTLSIVSLVLGIVGLVICCCGYGVPILFSVGALVTGIVARKKNKNGLNLAGIICGGIGILINVIMLVLSILGFGILGMMEQQY